MLVARFEIISSLGLFEPTVFGDGAEVSDAVTRDTKEQQSYRIRKSEDFPTNSYNHFPIIINADGSPWEEANMFLLDKLKSVKRVPSKTLESNAGDLVMFKRWLDSEDIDYLRFPKRIMARPTYRFCAYLHEQINCSNIKYSTAKRRMSTVQLFYRWLKDIRGVFFENPLWREKEVFISFKDNKGFSLSKKQITTDLAFKQVKNITNYSECIQDGGNLRPLSKEEQYALIEALKSIGNTEMTLSFMLALTTGARMQTVFTLRRRHFEQAINNSTNTVRINTGNGTYVDTKYGKNTVIHVPVWLYRRVGIYLQSQRAVKREQLSPHIYESDDLQYAFLTKSGKPFYMANSDPFVSVYRHPPRGISVNAFIKQQLYPAMEKQGHLFQFRFHDLRATFGMNLLEDNLGQHTSSLDGMNTNNLWSVLMLIQKRLGHSSITTTERYLNYRKQIEFAVTTQTDFENYLISMVD